MAHNFTSLVAGLGSIDIETLLKYELCSYPTAFFDQNMLMRQADKADLQNGLIKRVPECVTDKSPTGVVYVIDGGALLQRIPWPRSASYIAVTKIYIQYIQKHFSGGVLVVFDGYEDGPSTKDEAHHRRSGQEMGIDVNFTPEMTIKMKKKPFLANEKNKQRFLNLLGTELVKEPNIEVLHASADAMLIS